MAHEKSADLAERKLQIITKEWDLIQNVIRQEISLKARMRTLAMTAFSAICAISIHQQNNILPLAALPITLIFWYLDFSRQAIQTMAIELNNQLEESLENPTDENIINLRSPILSRHLADEQVFWEHKKRAMFRIFRILYYGSMLVGAVFLFAFL